ncbi:sodium/calcium exchanger 1-like [Tubulanus polymorphus]|uniref:sodium/calcium exchanger 1-like n=1 Tax=Tubulanus polymorphus TaxID=672921 RepID=UPI003DA4C49B
MHKMRQIIKGVFYPLPFIFVLMSMFSGASADENKTGKEEDDEVCKDGVFLPRWEPVGQLSTGDKIARATVYMSSMVFMFLGVSIIADRFMAAIEVITSKEKEVRVKKPNGEMSVISVRIWNETVSNLTLMALGSSAPEILLSLIEIVGKDFNAGDLGPGTIVGSAAFNLFIIIAICVYVIPDGEVRRIKHLRVFFITATWSIFAYLWLYMIIGVITPNRVDVWEALLTFLFFPLTVVTAYFADRKIFFYSFLSKKYRGSRTKKVVIQAEGDVEMADGKTNYLADGAELKAVDNIDPEVADFEKHRKDYIEIIRELRKKNPNIDAKTLEEMAQYEVMNRGPKSRAFYRIQATRKLTGGGNVIKRSKIERKASVEDVKLDAQDDITRICFEPGHYTVMENVGVFKLTVSRQGGDLDNTVYVDYKTEDGTANAGSDYEFAEGSIVFYPGETHKQFPITIIDDEIFEEDEHFYVRLSNIRIGDTDGMFKDNPTEKVQLVNPSQATVMILDDDHAGVFHFALTKTEVVESCGEAELTILRSSGARGRVILPYRTIDGSAKGGKDFETVDDEIVFENDETQKAIKIRIVDDEEYEKTEHFFVQLGYPKLGSKEKKPQKSVDELNDDEKVAEGGLPKLGEVTQMEVIIKESMEFKSTVDKLLKKANLSLVVGTSSWREQFIDAITVSAGGDDEDEDGEEKLPSCLDYVMHFLTIFWKVLFASVAPTDVWGGWACFSMAIIWIGILTAFIGDLASAFGCTVGLKDAVTAISFVALGTSVPDTFASKVAAVNDQYADSSIGNVTGSNGVNVFLGIGIAWLVATIVHAARGTTFKVKKGSLGFSVTIFCIFAFLAIIILVIRRHKSIGGELGGSKRAKIITACVLTSFWLTYLLLSSFESYKLIKGF